MSAEASACVSEREAAGVKGQLVVVAVVGSYSASLLGN